MSNLITRPWAGFAHSHSTQLVIQAVFICKNLPIVKFCNKCGYCRALSSPVDRKQRNFNFPKLPSLLWKWLWLYMDDQCQKWEYCCHQSLGYLRWTLLWLARSEFGFIRQIYFSYVKYCCIINQQAPTSSFWFMHIEHSSNR